MTQAEKIINYINVHGSITPMQAFTDLGITKLATRVSEMKRDGIQFDQEMIEVKNRDEETVRVMKYRLKEQ